MSSTYKSLFKPLLTQVTQSKERHTYHTQWTPQPPRIPSKRGASRPGAYRLIPRPVVVPRDPPLSTLVKKATASTARSIAEHPPTPPYTLERRSLPCGHQRSPHSHSSSQRTTGARLAGWLAGVPEKRRGDVTLSRKRSL